MIIIILTYAMLPPPPPLPSPLPPSTPPHTPTLNCGNFAVSPSNCLRLRSNTTTTAFGHRMDFKLTRREVQPQFWTVAFIKGNNCSFTGRVFVTSPLLPSSTSVHWSLRSMNERYDCVLNFISDLFRVIRTWLLR